LVYAQLVKKKKRGRLHSLNEHICWGAARLAALGQKISIVSKIRGEMEDTSEEASYSV
jgi:hypothetical protein